MTRYICFCYSKVMVTGEEKEFAIIPRVSSASKEALKIPLKRKYVGIKSPEIIICLAMFVAYLILISVITFLPIIIGFKVIGLLIGSFIIGDILQIIKRRMFED